MGCAVIRTVTCQDFVPPGIEACDLDGILVRLRATQREKGFLQIAWCNFCKFPAEQAAYFGGIARMCERQLRSLILNSLDDFWMLVPDIGIHQLRRKIKVALIISIPKIDTLCLRHRDGIHLFLN